MAAAPRSGAGPCVPRVLTALAVLLAVSFSNPAHAGIGSELVEWLARQGTKYADDLAGKGAGALARELDDLAAKAGSEAVEQMVKRGGPGALTLVRELGEQAPNAARLIAANGEAGTLVIRQGGRAAVEAFAAHGDGAVRVLATHGPKEGPRLLTLYGPALTQQAAKIAPQQQAVLRALAPQLEQAAPAVQASFRSQLAKGGDDFVQWVGKRWKPLGAAALLTVGTLTAYKVGDGLSTAMPNPATNPGAFLVWSLPLLAITLIVAGAWVMRGALREWLRARRATPPRTIV
ncbi:MAG: hypothetical protein ACKVS8_01145 [Phycisphaerales bacterium]